MIEVENLTKDYGDFSAIRDVSFTVNQGEILGFLGPNGAGKTTTMRILTGYLPATAGSARIAGFDVESQSMEVRRRIGYLPESPPLYLNMTVEAYLSFVAEIKGVVAGDRPERVNRVIDRCNLGNKRTSLIRKLSKGFKQRVGIAQALVHDPPAIVLDEPTSGLDPKQIIDVRNLIQSLAGEHTIVLSTHILQEVSMTCDRVVIINSGQVAAVGTPQELSEQASDRQRVVLELAGAESGIRSVLDQLPSTVDVGDLDQIVGDSQSRWSVELTYPAGSDAWIGQMTTALIGGGIEIYELRRSRASLEETFLKIITAREPALATAASA